MSSSGFKPLARQLQHEEPCPREALAQGPQGMVFLRVLSEDPQDPHLWGQGRKLAWAVVMSTEEHKPSHIS